MRYLFILIIIVILYLYVKRDSPYAELPRFMTKNETAQFLLQDKDGFLQSLNRLDLFARHVDSLNEYKSNIKDSAMDFTERQKQELITNSQKADDIFRSRGDQDIASIPWVFATTSTKYEEGFPHTRSGVIFIGSESDFKTLIHEKFHLYEKMIRLDPSKYGYVKSRPRKEVYRLRSNPDVDEWVWIDPKTKKEMVSVYNSDRPLGLTDAQKTDKYEHPYEYLAYTYYTAM
jgi:hypothetical protein